MNDMQQRAIDADFRPQHVDLSVVAPYISADWKGYLRIDEQGRSLPGTRVALPESVYWTRRYDEWKPLVGDESDAAGDDRGTEPRQSLADAQRYFDRYGIAAAVCNPGIAGGLSATGNAEYAMAVSRATNDWLVAEWLEREERALGSITVALRDPALAAAEIRRAAGHERMVQVLFAHAPRLLGDRALNPVWEAAVECGLPVCFEASGAFTGMSSGFTTTGNPASRFEYEVGWIHAAQPHLLSMITGGVFDRFPDLRLILSGFGISWLPSLIWRLDAERRTCPTEGLSPLAGAPEDYVRQHVRITSRRLDLPDDPARLVDLLSLVGGDELLMLASGPFGGTAEMRALLDGLPPEWRAKVAYENAAAVFPAVAADAQAPAA